MTDSAKTKGAAPIQESAPSLATVIDCPTSEWWQQADDLKARRLRVRRLLKRLRRERRG